MAEAVTRHARSGLRLATALRLVTTLLLALLVPFAAHAEILDWKDVTWPAGSLGPRVYTGSDHGSASVTTTVGDPSGSSPAGWPRLETGVSGFDDSVSRSKRASTRATPSPASCSSTPLRIGTTAPRRSRSS